MEKTSATQGFVPIKEIRDGVIVLKDNSLRAILMVSSLNFSLKSSDEQIAIIYQFQNFLNSLDFSTQIYIQSRKLDIRPYISVMEEKYKAQTNDLMKIQTREYIEFIKKFTESVNIMTKNFFIIVPYTPSFLGNSSKGPLGLGGGKKNTQILENDSFEESRSQLEQRANVIEQGLSRSGLRVARLGTEESVELLYKIFNPGESEKPIQLN
ncbi:TPA: hypothetical protein DCZ46_01230 [Candidatus Campbellbacteria bacterium]|uniref:TraC-like domain-containing protein n=2 Tax=Candidatus Campbelliibacteriota TaxID=1752727 RepID=A0A1F5ELY4_9BACT|nr:MAG: hypothetical protein UR58_C0001G0221 [Candidatus Campbellbacteria bacterium GW2011_OD1_34_28]KKP75292.1 MAG: hypothetical protein UR74_C0001G0148 [Candidatus Campbellbacteria bacterium GW2011_GWD2_35_24]KKP76147.1 MAG: hypothetical protein UR75_C0001G0181 [Candidatus Campbellbacteria bacterium GW2011_GWC2_35_28]KKP77336.1 MAG: hypothetical protein UR76_C0001G0181 [Candidatus Campbellbacteria bacterium GW2011_GWC1_35_31]KKP79265.1 MAG: hypothetical protein UR79_C0001G0181 [Candidatus Cam